MKAQNGSKGMSDSQVEASVPFKVYNVSKLEAEQSLNRFVDRYIPGYVFFWRRRDRRLSR